VQASLKGFLKRLILWDYQRGSWQYDVMCGLVLLFMLAPHKWFRDQPRLQYASQISDGVFWIDRTGSPWRDLPEYFGDYRTVHRQFRRWVLSGVFDVILEAMNESGAGQDSVQMIDSTVIRAHQHSAGAKKRALMKVLGALVVASRRKST